MNKETKFAVAGVALIFTGWMAHELALSQTAKQREECHSKEVKRISALKTGTYFLQDADGVFYRVKGPAGMTMERLRDSIDTHSKRAQESPFDKLDASTPAVVPGSAEQSRLNAPRVVEFEVSPVDAYDPKVCQWLDDTLGIKFLNGVTATASALGVLFLLPISWAFLLARIVDIRKAIIGR